MFSGDGKVLFSCFVRTAVCSSLKVKLRKWRAPTAQEENGIRVRVVLIWKKDTHVYSFRWEKHIEKLFPMLTSRYIEELCVSLSIAISIYFSHLFFSYQELTRVLSFTEFWQGIAKFLRLTALFLRDRLTT